MLEIQDQRTMTGHRVHASPDDVKSEWRARARSVGFHDPRSGRRTFELEYALELESDVHVSHGRYCADCPREGCGGAAAVWVENPEACCLGCGLVFTPRWPSVEEIGGAMGEVVEVLLLRPFASQRNFRASDKTETLADLKAQNALMGDPFVAGAR